MTTWPPVVDSFPSAATLETPGHTLANLNGLGLEHSDWMELVGTAIAALQLHLGSTISVTMYGADKTGVVDATAAIHAARDALPSTGGTLFFPAGTYKTTGLEFKDKPIRVIGAGAIGQQYSSGDYTRASTRIKSTTNAPIVKFTETSKTSIEGQFSSIENIGILGSSAGSSQIGLVVDNRGFYADNMHVAGCGSHGILVADCVGGRFCNVDSFRNNGHGWMIDPTQGTGAGSAVTSTTFDTTRSTSNGVDGWRVGGASESCKWDGGYVESNAQWGMKFATISAQSPRSHWVVGMHDESNLVGGFSFADAGVIGINVIYLRTDGVFQDAGSRCSFIGPNTSLINAAQRWVWQLGDIKATRLTSSDLQRTRFRNVDDTGNGIVEAESLMLTYGLTVDPEDLTNSLSVPQNADTINLPNGRGMTWRNTANSGNISGVCMSDVVNDAITINATQGALIAKTGSKVGFYGTTPITKPAVTGSRGGNAAVASLLTTLVNLGLITDSSTA